MDHSSMDMGSSSTSSSGSMSMMSMDFTNDHSAPLYSSAWTPKTSGGYAGTCIFLVFLAVISRLLIAYRHVLESKWHNKAVKRRYIKVAVATETDRERQPSLSASEKSEAAVLTVRGMDETVRVVRSPAQSGITIQPWRFSVDLPRACVFTVQAGVGYLLMLAVMTLNVGYFLSVLAGLFVGELAVGRYAQADDGHH
ncbi:hypothetical protein B0A48_07469 [Cryoendolithus antarcticus]|uniref:Copper transport protein n=1 Tax=Cryoendolithus antarcticus TaxID=1507870 RepID=A0A1V8T671_9PEZI|nr:hypothetical protein B0A48_07469 [Cryoendolithus antarcticus]